jgi:hypothetical protein
MQTGYSGLSELRGTNEYVRFFIDWDDGTGFQSAGLAHFKVFDAKTKSEDEDNTVYRMISRSFDIERYRKAVEQGKTPTVRAVLSWNYVPDVDAHFSPVFGNRLESQVCVDSESVLLELFQNQNQKEKRPN